MYLEATYVNELLTKSLDLVLINLKQVFNGLINEDPDQPLTFLTFVDSSSAIAMMNNKKTPSTPDTLHDMSTLSDKHMPKGYSFQSRYQAR